MTQRTMVNALLEGNDVVGRIPEVNPAVDVELGMLGGIEPDHRFVGEKVQQEPDLLLPDADGLLMASAIAP